MFFGSALLTFALMTWVPATRDYYVTPFTQQAFNEWKKPFDERTSSQSAMMTGFYLSNNPKTAVIAGAVSASTFGFGTAYLLYENGAILGALAKELQPYGKTAHL